MAQTVKVRLRKSSRVFTFLCRNIDLKRNDACIIRTDRGLEFGACVLPPEESGPEAKERFKMSVVRRATDHDKMTQRQIGDDEERAKEVCSEKIKARDLPMKLVDCEYSFDRRKVVFYFTAEDRVDFRQLVRDLARELKTRIELRHIQVRDQAKIIGGIGTCGRELCCTTWMKEFIPISMRMAKRQNLSLNPSKISGQCGRLMCCLSYENELYSGQKRAKPTSWSTEPYDLAGIRDRMEDDAPKAVEVLTKSSLSEVAERSAAAKENEGAEAAQVDENSPVDGKQDGDRTEAAERTDAQLKPSPRRRKRRRGRRGKDGAGGEQGGGSGQGKDTA